MEDSIGTCPRCKSAPRVKINIGYRRQVDAIIECPTGCWVVSAKGTIYDEDGYATALAQWNKYARPEGGDEYKALQPLR